MRSSSGKYYIALDHVRALAALLVFVWHFIHASSGYPVPFEYAPSIFLFSIFNEGHTGVAIFMTLSGYLFAKLLEDKRIRYGHFLWNRFLRLGPLLLFVMFLVGLQKYMDGVAIDDYTLRVIKGLILPVLPNGGWSITAEFHFYLVLPILLWLSWKSKYGLLAIVLGMIGFRVMLFDYLGEIQRLSYWTIIGRIDQFILGIVAYRFHERLGKSHILAVVVAASFLLFFWWFDLQGGFYNNPSYPSPSALWIIMPTMEGIAYAILIGWYDNSFNQYEGRVSRFISLIGTYSYSIYLFHFFIVFRLAYYINNNVIDLSNFYVALVVAVACFLLMVPIGYISYRFIESPFLKLRTRYIVDSKPLILYRE